MPSVHQLRSKITKHLKSKFGASDIRYRFSLMRFPPHSMDISEGVIDLVLMGEGFGLFADEDVWPVHQKYRLWVTCEKARSLLVELVQLPRKSVGVIDRYEIFSKPNGRLQKGKIKTLVYAGRDVEGKNLIHLIKAYYKLQSESDKLRLVLCCPDLKPNTMRILQTLKWKNSPQVYEQLGDRWIKQPFENPCWISLSTYRYEDFSTAAAIAQQAGWPVIAADWYAFQDVAGAYLINTNKLNKPSELALSIQKILEGQWPGQIKKTTQAQVPAILESSDVVSYIKKMSQRKKAQLYNYFNPGSKASIPFDRNLEEQAYDVIYRLLKR